MCFVNIFRCDSISRIGVLGSQITKPNIGDIAKHGAIIEYTLNVFWMYIEILQNMVQYLFKHFEHIEHFEHFEHFEHLVIRQSGFAIRLCNQALESGFGIRLWNQALELGFGIRLWNQALESGFGIRLYNQALQSGQGVPVYFIYADYNFLYL